MKRFKQMYKILFTLSAFLFFCFSSLMAQKSQISYFSSWPEGKSPTTIGKLVAEHFAATPHQNFNRSKPPKYITYPETCTWYGALKFAKITDDEKLMRELVERFQPLFGNDSTLIPKPTHVDYSVFGSVPLELIHHNQRIKRLTLTNDRENYGLTKTMGESDRRRINIPDKDLD